MGRFRSGEVPLCGGSAVGRFRCGEVPLWGGSAVGRSTRVQKCEENGKYSSQINPSIPNVQLFQKTYHRSRITYYLNMNATNSEIINK